MLPGGGSKLVLFSARKTKTTHHLTPWTRLLVLGHAAARAALLMQNVSATSRMINFRYVLKQLNPKEQPLVIVSFLLLFSFIFMSFGKANHSWLPHHLLGTPSCVAAWVVAHMLVLRVLPSFHCQVILLLKYRWCLRLSVDDNGWQIKHIRILYSIQVMIY